MELILIILGYIIISLAAISTAYNLYEKVVNRAIIFESIPLEWKIQTIIMGIISICLILFVVLFGIYIIVG